MEEAPQSILVLGAGELGTAVLTALAKHLLRRSDTTITVLLRASSINAAKYDHLRALGVAFEAGDIQDNTTSELAAIFRQHSTIISCTGYGAPPGTQLKITRAVLEAGGGGSGGGPRRRRYFPWQWGMDYEAIGSGSAQDLFDEQLEVRGLLRGADADPKAEKRDGEDVVDWVIVSTGLFMSFLFLPDFGPVDLPNRVLRALGGWDTAISVTTPRDIGVVAAELVYAPAGVSRQVVFVAGDTVTYGRLADLVEARFLGEFRREVWELDFLRSRAAEHPENGMFKYQAVFAAGRGVAFEQSRTLNFQRGIALQGVESYLREMELPGLS